ncbi:uncharacterized protein LOC131938164 [Physella acuta]|uniref:uncharacterized protein LOC131938164 n=1 Tax=Physella acuta TaxID=109671 RepID=UPI0027DC0EB0|nr:uncharacterized protein LOC131938164 [Physella acuta]
MMTGQSPYSNIPNSPQVIIQIHKGILPTLGKIVPSQPLNIFLEKTFQQLPKQRPSAKDLLTKSSFFNSELIGKELRQPKKVLALELEDGTVQVEIFAKGLQPGKDVHRPKNGTVLFDWLNSQQGFDIMIKLADRTVQLIVKRMPGKIVGEKSTWHVEKDKVVIRMKKAVDVPWADILHTNGIDMGSSSSEED